ncbi:MAG: hypothetical protein AAB359_03025, partial [Elusimicrobiota bacterium]
GECITEEVKMAEMIQKVGLKREKGFLYFIDKAGDISCAVMARGKKKGGKTRKVTKIGLKKEKGYLYFIDKKGDVSRAIMKNSGKRKK